MADSDAVLPPDLDIASYFVVEMAGTAGDFTKTMLHEEFGQNFHVRHPSVFKKTTGAGMAEPVARGTHESGLVAAKRPR